MAHPLHSPAFYAGDPYPTYRELRATDPVCWNEAAGIWALLKYEDIRYVSTNPALFSSAKGITIPDPAIESPVLDGSLLFTDPPRHRQLRKLINTGFTRRQVAVLEPKLRTFARSALDEIDPARTEFAEQIAAPLPTRMIAELLGAPDADWERFRTWSDATVGTDDPDVELDTVTAIGELFEYFSELIALRRSGALADGDDLLSVLVAAAVDGVRLSDQDLLHFCLVLLVAGNETTRNLIALGTLALIEHPEQFLLLRDQPELIPTAVEELLRFTTPVANMSRCATRDVEIRGQLIREGQFVTMLYGSANRDEDVFGPTAEQLDITRNPNPHLTFGCGEHSCLGAQLARLEARVLFEELLARFDRIDLDGAIVRMQATMVPGVKQMPVRLATTTVNS
ncbi:linalool 8-monooxygenase [Mycolicibacterium cyprinidarum]|uniref:Linalool 8-monooxygenase n=1 Tax=Mycolicibacterium cyprinidarum TaxID=2860311 RepID=A0ABQ4V7A4_9MYCO|nr:linalool 8-monooxygenase [Mycolicibacterium sp. NGTWSNA01]GJF20075.1 linalool 8-monooxygenase [Mycolicibacterium sp. NGTWS0302]